MKTPKRKLKWIPVMMMAEGAGYEIIDSCQGEQKYEVWHNCERISFECSYDRAIEICERHARERKAK